MASKIKVPDEKFSSLHVTVMFPPLNEGEDMNWVNLMIIGHKSKDKVNRPTIDELVQKFLENPVLDEESDEWGDLSEDEMTALFLNFAADKGYTIFRPVRINYCAR